MKKTDRQIEEAGKWIGEWEDKFRLFHDDPLKRSLWPVLIERFGMTFFSRRVHIYRNGEAMEIGALAYASTAAPKYRYLLGA